MTILRRSLLRLGFSILIVFTGSSTALAGATIEAFVTATLVDGQPVAPIGQVFRCSDKIYAVIDVSGLANGDHVLNVDWIDPSGKRREQTVYEFNRSGGIRITVWLKLHAPSGASLLSAFNPALGMGEFIGPWEVRMTVDRSSTTYRNFEVLC